MRGAAILRAVVVCCLVVATLTVSPVADAKTFVVTRLDDPVPGKCDNDCSLREAFTAANGRRGRDKIVIPKTPAGPIGLTQPAGILLVNPPPGGGGRITLDANGHTIDQLVAGQGVFNVQLGGRFTLREAIVTGGEATFGGAISNGGRLKIVDSTITGNTATQSGGGISNSVGGTLSVVRSAITGNAAAASGGGLANGHLATISRSLISGNTATSGAGISTVHDLTITDTTISGNEADGGGGGIVQGSGGGDAIVKLLHVTITDNVADMDANDDGDGGGVNAGIYVVESKASIIAENLDNSPTANLVVPDCDGAVVSLDFNVVGVNSGCVQVAQPDDLLGTSGSPVDPGLGVLASNGGPTLTHATGLLFSPGVGRHLRSDSDCGGKDQRGVPHRFQGHCDAGAYELAFCVNRVNVVGTNRGEVVFGTPGNDGMLALGGDDVIFGVDGNDGLCGGSGNDILHGSAGDDVLMGQAGPKDACYGGADTDTLKPSCEKRVQD